jgi:hypothetical protein
MASGLILEQLGLNMHERRAEAPESLQYDATKAKIRQ